jgi:hypothetical protein
MTFKPEIFAQEGDQQCAPGNLIPSPSWADWFTITEVDIPTERDETKPCRPIYCAKHYGGEEETECVRAYHCPGVENAP